MEGLQTFTGTEPADHVPPTFAYEHPNAQDHAPGPGDITGCSILGGGVHRGSLLPSLTGRYLFADACTGKISAVTPDGSSSVADLGVSIYHSDVWNDPNQSCVIFVTFDEDNDNLPSGDGISIGHGDGSVSQVVVAP